MSIHRFTRCDSCGTDSPAVEESDADPVAYNNVTPTPDDWTSLYVQLSEETTSEAIAAQMDAARASGIPTHLVESMARSAGQITQVRIELHLCAECTAEALSGTKLGTLIDRKREAATRRAGSAGGGLGGVRAFRVVEVTDADDPLGLDTP